MKKTSPTPDKLHTLKNHLTSISLSAELLLKEIYGPTGKQQKKCLQGIISEGKKMLKIINTLKEG